MVHISFTEQKGARDQEKTFDLPRITENLSRSEIQFALLLTGRIVLTI